jgi:hypothetical protein
VPRLTRGRGQRTLITEPAQIAPDPDGERPPANPSSDSPLCDPLSFDPRFRGAEAADEDAEGDLAEWCERHRGSLLWGVGAGIAEALVVARQEAQAAGPPSESEDEGDDTPSAAEERRTLRGRLRRTLFASTALAFIAAVLAGSRLSLVGIGVALIAIGFVWFFVLASPARPLFLADEQISRREDERELAKVNAAMRRSLRMGDEIRLGLRYREYLAWAEILGWIVHKPWVGDPLDRVTLMPPIDHSSLPAAFTVGVAEVSGHSIERLSAATGSGVFSSGWLKDVYERSESLEMRELGLRRGLSPPDRCASPGTGGRQQGRRRRTGRPAAASRPRRGQGLDLRRRPHSGREPTGASDPSLEGRRREERDGGDDPRGCGGDGRRRPIRESGDDPGVPVGAARARPPDRSGRPGERERASLVRRR